jgi:hypothetical protein
MQRQAPGSPCASWMREVLKRPRLAAWWAQARALSVGQHARGLWAGFGRGPAPHPGLLRAFAEGLGHVEEEGLRGRALWALGVGAPIQTASHVGASQGPVMAAATRMLAVGAPAGVPVLVGAWSALPFDNVARAGCLNLGERAELEAWVEPGSGLWRAQRRAWADRARDGAAGRRISLIPASMREAAVVCARVPGRLLEVLGGLRPEARALLPEAQEGASFALWALRACAGVEQRALGREVVWFDLCACAARLLGELLDDPGEPVARLLSDPRWWGALSGGLPRAAAWWEVKTRRGGGEVLEGVGVARAAEGARSAGGLGGWAARLREGSLWPGVPVALAALAACGAGRLVGGVDQWEYAPRVWAACEAAGWGGAQIFLREGGLPEAVSEGLDGLVVGRWVDARGEGVTGLEAARWGQASDLEGDAGAPLEGWMGAQWVGLRGRPSPLVGA